MKLSRTGFAAAFWLATAGLTAAAPPGPVDGQNIPSNFGPANLVATQTNYTHYGDYQVTPGAFLPGSETDQLFLARDADTLYVAITGNLERVGHAWMIGIDLPGRQGQSENRTEGVAGPPTTLQQAARRYLVLDNETPEDPTDDYWEYGADGMIFPCDTDYVLAVDTWDGVASFSEYELFDPDGPPIGYRDLTPGQSFRSGYASVCHSDFRCSGRDERRERRLGVVLDQRLYRGRV